jgi:phosphate transport system substrate-binding protein
MNKLYRLSRAITLSVVLSSGGIACASDITGAGATFPAMAYEKWGTAFKTSDFSLNYQALGSGAGIKQIFARIVDFGASDVPMSADELSKNGLTQFPVLIGGIVPVVNLAGVAPGKMKLKGDVLADIFMGKITQWNDPRIAADNKDLALPDQRIAVVYRADESGTAFTFTSYLSLISPDWKRNVGAGKSVRWPVGVGAKGNEGVAGYVHRLQGSIGFVEYADVIQNKMTYVQLRNRDGQFVSPSEASLKATAAYASWDAARGFGVSLLDQPGKESWPITMTTYIVLYKVQSSPERGKSVLGFFDRAFKDGAQIASELGYVPLPENVVKLIRATWKAEVKDVAGNALWQ